MSCGASWYRTSCYVGLVSIGQVGIGPIDLGQIVLTPIYSWTIEIKMPIKRVKCTPWIQNQDILSTNNFLLAKIFLNFEFQTEQLTLRKKLIAQKLHD